MVYTYTYTDCANHTHVLNYFPTRRSSDLTLPADGASTVNCPADAVAPGSVPVVKDACSYTLTTVVATPSTIACNGTMVYTYTYTDCANHTHVWKYTYTIATPDFTLPADGASTVNCPRSEVHTSALQSLKNVVCHMLPPVIATPSPIACNE